MPAVVSSTDGSNVAGTSEADGRRRWPRCSKYDRKVSRISSEVTPRLWRIPRRRPRAAGTRSGRARRRARARRARGCSPARRARHRGRAVAELHGVDLGRVGVQADAPQTRTVVVASAVLGPTVTVFARASVASTYSGSSSPPIPRPRRWPTVKWWWPRWRPTRRPARSTMSPGRSRRAPWRARNRARPVPARKQRSCESALLATGRPAARAIVADLGLARAGRRAGSAGARARRGSARRACSSGPWPGRRPGAGGRRACGGRSGRSSASRRRGGRRTRASRRGGRGRCSRRTGSGSGRRRGRRATGRRRPPGTRRAGRS